ncbi:MAG: hypothetical protein AAF961_14275, partial [Planctomycetota bacterium]
MLAITVDTLSDVLDPDDGLTTLREAVASAEPGDTIDFSVTGRVLLSQNLGQITIDKPLTINGPGADLLTIDAGNGADGEFGTRDGFRVFSLEGGEDPDTAPVVIKRMTLTGGDTLGGGGAVRNEGLLRLHNVATNKNHATDGAGLANYGTAIVTGSSFVENFASYIGGGIVNGGGLELHNSTVSGNRANYGGGGLFSGGRSTIVGSTFAENWADYTAGIHNEVGTTT